MSQGASAADFRFCPRCGAGVERKQLKASEPSRLVCQAQGCGFVLYLDPKLAACTITLVDGGIVLLRRAIEPQRGKWVFPGGYVDRGESVIEAAVRETYEEVGLRVAVTGILDVYSTRGEDVAVVVYAAHAEAGKPEAGDEASEVKVFSPEAIPWDELAFESTRLALRSYLSRFFPRVRAPR